MTRLLDDSSINAALTLHKGDYHTHYYKALNQCKEHIKKNLKSVLSIPHPHIFLMANSTHCLLTVMYGLAASKRHLVIEEGNYQPFNQIPRITGGLPVSLVTHIAPESGVTSPVNDHNIVLDAAQSAGTICYHSIAMTADIVFFPLHKHLALQTGIGVLCVSANREYKNVVSTAQVCEAGTGNSEVFTTLRNRLVDKSIVFNIAIFDLNQYRYNLFKKIGFISITPLHSKTPYLVFKLALPIHTSIAINSEIFSIKIMNKSHCRITCYKPGTMDSSPVDFSDMLIELLRKQQWIVK